MVQMKRIQAFRSAVKSLRGSFGKVTRGDEYFSIYFLSRSDHVKGNTEQKTEI